MSRVAVPCQAEARELRRAGMSKEGTGRLAWGGAACPPLRLRMCAGTCVVKDFVRIRCWQSRPGFLARDVSVASVVSVIR